MSNLSLSQRRTEALSFIAPLEITLPVDGCDVTITPLVMRELPLFTELMLPIMSSLSLTDGMVARLKDGQPTDADLSAVITTLAVSGQTLIDMLVLCTRSHVPHGIQPRVEGADHATWIGNLLPDRALSLASVCLQVNADFFARAMPNLRALASRLPATKSAASTPTDRVDETQA